MDLLRADLSEAELQRLEKKFAAGTRRSADTHIAPSFIRHGEAGDGGEDEGVRYVELLHWGAPDKKTNDGGEEVRFARGMTHGNSVLPAPLHRHEHLTY